MVLMLSAQVTPLLHESTPTTSQCWLHLPLQAIAMCCGEVMPVVLAGLFAWHKLSLAWPMNIAMLL